MKRYPNFSGESGVDAYELGPNFIKIRFRAGVVYRYTKASVGARHMSALKRLARRGWGLATYISQHPDVSGGYAEKKPGD